MTALACALVAAFAVERWARVAESWLAKHYPTPDPEQAAPVVVPPDIMALAMQHTEAWAREDVLKVATEQYATLRDWNRVRAVLGIGQMES